MERRRVYSSFHACGFLFDSSDQKIQPGCFTGSLIRLAVCVRRCSDGNCRFRPWRQTPCTIRYRLVDSSVACLCQCCCLFHLVLITEVSSGFQGCCFRFLQSGLRGFPQCLVTSWKSQQHGCYHLYCPGIGMSWHLWSQSQLIRKVWINNSFIFLQ